jgi:hypothetical protein
MFGFLLVDEVELSQRRSGSGEGGGGSNTYPFTFNLAVDEGSGEASPTAHFSKVRSSEVIEHSSTNKISLALECEAGLPFAATCFSYAWAACVSQVSSVSECAARDH